MRFIRKIRPDPAMRVFLLPPTALLLVATIHFVINSNTTFYATMAFLTLNIITAVTLMIIVCNPPPRFGRPPTQLHPQPPPQEHPRCPTPTSQ